MARYPRHRLTMTKFHFYYIAQVVNLIPKEVDRSRLLCLLSHPQMLFLFTISVIRNYRSAKIT